MKGTERRQVRRNKRRERTPELDFASSLLHHLCSTVALKRCDIFSVQLSQLDMEPQCLLCFLLWGALL